MNNLLGLERMKLLKLMILLKLKIMILPLDMNCLLYLRVMLWMKKLLETSLLAMIESNKDQRDDPTVFARSFTARQPDSKPSNDGINPHNLTMRK